MENSKEFTYGFLRQEMEDLAARQDNFFSIAYAGAAALWTAAVSVSGAYISLITIVLIITFSAKISDIWNGYILISCYIKNCLEDDTSNDWERMLAAYYKKNPFGFKRKLIRKGLKYTFPLLNVISCVIFWAIKVDSVAAIFASGENIAMLSVQAIVCIWHFIFWVKNYECDAVRRRIDDNWKEIAFLAKKGELDMGSDAK